jgi:hypothetical protein
MRCEALLLLSDAQRALGDRQAARDAATGAAEEARATGDPIMLAPRRGSARASPAQVSASTSAPRTKGSTRCSSRRCAGCRTGARTTAPAARASMTNAAADGDLVTLRE